MLIIKLQGARTRGVREERCLEVRNDTFFFASYHTCKKFALTAATGQEPSFVQLMLIVYTGFVGLKCLVTWHAFHELQYPELDRDELDRPLLEKTGPR